jgi:hypothetical protein
MEEGSAIGTFSLVAYVLGPVLLAAVLAFAITKNRRRKAQRPLAPGERDTTPRAGDGPKGPS